MLSVLTIIILQLQFATQEDCTVHGAHAHRHQSRTPNREEKKSEKQIAPLFQSSHQYNEQRPVI